MSDPACKWRDDRCSQHGAAIDDPGNRYDHDTQRWTCWLSEGQAA